MATSETGILNVGLTLLGEAHVLSMQDDVKPAREALVVFDTVRDSLLGAYDWNFAKDRAALAALTTTPAFEFSYQYQLPSDCLRVVMAGDFYVGMDLTDYRGSPTEEYALEGRKILTNWGAPLNIKYVKRVTDVAQFDPCFSLMFSAKLAYVLCEALTQSSAKQDAAEKFYNSHLKAAFRANAISLPPKKLPDDEWVMSRL